MPDTHSVQFSLVARSFPTTYHSTTGFPVHHQLPEFAQTHVHWVGDAIQPSHPLSTPSPPARNLSQHQGLFKWVSSLHEVAKVWEFPSATNKHLNRIVSLVSFKVNIFHIILNWQLWDFHVIQTRNPVPDFPRRLVIMMLCSHCAGRVFNPLLEVGSCMPHERPDIFFFFNTAPEILSSLSFLNHPFNKLLFQNPMLL